MTETRTTELRKGIQESDWRSPVGKLDSLKALLSRVLPQRHRPLRTSPRMTLTSQAGRRCLAVTKTKFETWTAQAYETHRRTSIR